MHRGVEGKVDPFELEPIEGCRTRKEHVRRLPAIAGEQVVTWMESLRLFCLQIFSPPLPQFRAWSPSTSLGLEQAGQRPALSNSQSHSFACTIWVCQR